MAEAPPTTNGTSPKPTIVLIHGLWMSPSCWEDWTTFFSSKGYTAIAPGWPGLNNLTVQKNPENPQSPRRFNYRQNHQQLRQDNQSPPLTIHHNRALIRRSLHANPPFKGPRNRRRRPIFRPTTGVLTLKLSTVKAEFGVLGNPLNYNKAVPISASQFHYNFGNHLNATDSKALYEKYAIPAAGHILFQGVLGLLNKKGKGSVDFGKKDRAPLLLVAGTTDHVVPRGVVEAEKKHYVGPAVMEYKVFEGRTHGIVNQAGWEEVADFALK
ncbi:uncharacterized protein PAC_11038 [Phialocephala subalpina]|uniref:AB hydrolase-1 domain-containing protein n=1 Tax=Phialocephala subalpina TaxID=576137 RepID=A0A1L7X7Z9_9HELO|nr:uncharacterized protein PAC_11038 [Phialocephala subalpina]